MSIRDRNVCFDFPLPAGFPDNAARVFPVVAVVLGEPFFRSAASLTHLIKAGVGGVDQDVKIT
jgi:hypothetical protein